jgi:queuine tRNA-ribosyltransferase
MTIGFSVDSRDGEARLGTLRTPHGELRTPFFMPVATAASVKGLTVEEFRALGSGIVLCNTYHLMLRPGIEVLERVGGLHAFMGWDGPILTDSGGFQVFSLGATRTVREEGVEFRSHLDGTPLHLSPEISIAMQERMGVDIAMAFDECPAPGLPKADVQQSMELTHRWAERSIRARSGRSALFGIVQGGIWEDLRQESIRAISSLDFDGVAIGGLSVGETKEEMLRTIRFTAPRLPDEKPRYLMGAGTPEDILDAVEAGIDMFDCVMPTRNARNGTLFTRDGKISIKNARYRDDTEPVDRDCGCLSCRTVSRAYLRHLYVSGEIAASVYNTIHNLRFYLDLMEGIRQAIASRRFVQFRDTFLARMNRS